MDRENGALWGNGSPKGQESEDWRRMKSRIPGAADEGRARDEAFARTGKKKIPRPSKRAGAKRRIRLHRMVHTGISGKEILRFVNRRQTEGDEF